MDVDLILIIINRITAIGAILLVFILVRHAIFFASAKDSITAKRTLWVFLAEIFATFSILSFSGAMFFLTPQDWLESETFRVSLKLFQLFSVYLTLWASYRFGEHYRKLK